MTAFFRAVFVAILLPYLALPAAGQDQAALNDQVRAQLAALGDDGTAPRETLHYAYPLGATSRPYAQLQQVVEIMGFATRPAEVDGGLVMIQTAPVAGEAFDGQTEALSVLFDQAGWIYEGWECALVQGE